MSSASALKRAIAPLVQFRRRLQGPEKAWAEGLADEEAFWDNVIAVGGKNRETFLHKLDPASPLSERLVPFIPAGDPVRILDVGAGPLTVIGKVLPGRTLSITATDALADRFNAMLSAKELVAPVPTVQCETERLDERFGAGEFDVAHAANTLDHHRDPIAAIDQMVRATRSGGSIILTHKENEAEKAHYNGLHQYNFSLDNGAPMIWNRRTRINLDEHLADRAECIHCERTETEKGAGVIFLVYRKR